MHNFVVFVRKIPDKSTGFFRVWFSKLLIKKQKKCYEIVTDLHLSVWITPWLKSRIPPHDV